MKLIDADQLNSHIVLYDGKFHRMVFQDDIDQLAEQSNEKYDKLNERYHRLLESAKILSDAVSEYERREEHADI